MSEIDPPLVPRFLQGNAAPAAPSAAPPPDDDTRTVRPFVVTGGRTGASSPFKPETQLVAIADPSKHAFEAGQLLELAQTPLSTAEASALLKLPLQAIYVLAEDLVRSGAMQARTTQGSAADPATIRRLMDAVSAL